MADGPENTLDVPVRQAPADPACPAVGGSGFVEVFVREQYRDLLKFLSHRSQRAEDAEDATQESLVRFIRYSETEPREAWKPLLYRIAINLLNDRSRRSQSHHEAAHIPIHGLELQSDHPSAEDAAVRAQQLAMLREGILALPPKCRQVYLLKRLRGMTNAAIAKHCGISVKMVEKHTAHAMLLLRQRWGDTPPDAY